MGDTVNGTATRMGWVKRRGGEKFEITIQLSSPPTWPIDVVWNSTPIELSLKTAEGKNDGN